MPIFVILLFYAHDLVRISRYYSQTEFVAQQMVNILQNISRKRAQENQDLQLTDYKYAGALAFLTIYPGTTQYATTNNTWRHTLRHVPWFNIYRVDGTGDGKAKCTWGKYLDSGYTSVPPWNDTLAISSNAEWSSVNYSSSAVTPSSIYKTLKIDGTSTKIILESVIFWNNATCGANGQNATNERETFGLRFVTPKNIAGYSNTRKNQLYFPSIVIFTPNNPERWQP